jgi:predicted regulator of Ras-like GTPase activity (Roadblock/LC7/MglB family)
MFDSRLRELLQRVEGACAVSLVASDGISVQSVVDGPGPDLEVLAGELLSQVGRVSDLSVGKVDQFVIAADAYTVMLGRLTDSYFLMLVLGEEGNFGRARFELRRAPLEFERDLV